MEQIFRNKTAIVVAPSFCLYCVLAIFIFPVKWILAWLIAAAVHELAHIAALYFHKIDVSYIKINFCGTVIETAPMDRRVECIVAAAGPLSGVLLLFISKSFPQLFICAFFQTLYNILPIFNHDGSRVLKCVLQKFLSNNMAHYICVTVGKITGILLVGVCVFTTYILKLGFVPMITWVILLYKILKIKIPCKRAKQIVQ